MQQSRGMQRFAFQLQQNSSGNLFQREDESTRRPGHLMHFRFPSRAKEPVPMVAPEVVQTHEGQSDACFRNSISTDTDTELVPKAMNEFRSMLASKNDQLTNKALELQQLNKKCRNQTEQIVNLQAEKETLKTNLEIEISTRAAILEKVNQNVELCLGLQQRVDEIVAKLDAIDESIIEFATRNAERMDKLSSLEEDFNSLSLSHGHIASELTEKYVGAMDAKKLLGDELQAQINNWQEKANGLEKELKSSSEFVAELEDKTATLCKSLEESEASLNRLKVDLEEKSKQIQEVQDLKEKAVVEMSQANENLRLESEERILKMDETHKEEMEKHRYQMELLSNDLQAQIEKHTVLLKEYDALKHKITELESELGDLRNLNKELNASLEDAVEVRSNLEVLKSDLDDKLQELEGMRIEILKLQAENVHLNVALEKSVVEKEAVEKICEASNKNIQDKEMEMAKLKEHLQNEVSKSNETNQDLVLKIEKLEETMGSNEVEIHQLRELNAKCEIEKQELSNKFEVIDQLREELSTEKAKDEQKSEKIQELQQLLDTVTKETCELKDAIEKLTNDLDNSRSDVSRLNNDITENLWKHDAEKQQMTKNYTFNLEKCKLDGERHASKISAQLSEVKAQNEILSMEKDVQLEKLNQKNEALANNSSIALQEKNAIKCELAKVKKEYEEKLLKLTLDNERLSRSQRSFVCTQSPKHIAKNTPEPEPIIGRASGDGVANLGGPGGILKRKFDESASISQAKHVAFRSPTTSNSETSQSSCLEVEFVDSSSAMKLKKSSPSQLPSIVLRPSMTNTPKKQLQQQPQQAQRQMMPFNKQQPTKENYDSGLIAGRSPKPLPRGPQLKNTQAVTPQKSKSSKSVGKGSGKKRLASRDIGLAWMNDPESD